MLYFYFPQKWSSATGMPDINVLLTTPYFTIGTCNCIISDTQKNIDRENAAIKELEKQKAHISQIPHSSQEYLR